MNIDEIEYTFAIAQHGSRFYGSHAAFMQYNGKKWVSVSFDEFDSLSDYLACALIHLEIEKGTRVATIFSANSYEWHIIDAGLTKAGLVHVPVYPTLSDSDYRYIFSQIEARCIMVYDQGTYNKIIQLLPDMPWVKSVYSVQQLVNVQPLKQLIRLGEEVYDRHKQILRTRMRECSPDGVATIIYTSGTTGFPKGVMLSHKNLITNARAAANNQPLTKGHRVLSFLPLCHIYERTANYQFLMKGVTLAFCSSMKNLFADFETLRPDGTTVVPRVLEKVIQKTYARTIKIKKPLQNALLWALQWGLEYNRAEAEPNAERLKRWIANFLLFRSIRQSFGGKCRYIGCGGAHLMPQIEQFFWAAGMPVYQGYGLTECSPLVSLNDPQHVKTGTVGKIIEGVEVRFSHQNEILVKGSNVMMGYFGNEKETRSTLVDGWLHTGDMGVMDGGFLKIIGRTKQMFKTSYGKYIVPQVIESKFALLPEIDHSVVLGEGKHCAAAIIVPNFTYLRELFDINDEAIGNEQLLVMTKVKKQLEAAIIKVNRQLGKTEQIKKCLFVADEWGVESGEISSTFKIRRNLISRKYQLLIQKLFSEPYQNQTVYDDRSWEVPPDTDE